jgi:hypothetical protein
MRFPYDLTLDMRRAHSRRLFRRQLAWLSLYLALVLVCVSLGVLIATTNSLSLSFLAGFLILAGLKSAHYLLTRH